MSLKSRREALGLTQEDVAALAGVHPNYYSQIERGRIKLPEPDLRRALSAALRIRHVDYLVEVGQLEDWELPGFSADGTTPSAPQPDPDRERFLALLDQIDLAKDNRGITLDVVLRQWAQQDRATVPLTNGRHVAS